MLTHFQYHPFLDPETRKTNYRISFYHKGSHCRGTYHYNGEISWTSPPDEADQKQLISNIQELMLYHVYDS